MCVLGLYAVHGAAGSPILAVPGVPACLWVTGQDLHATAPACVRQHGPADLACIGGLAAAPARLDYASFSSLGRCYVKQALLLTHRSTPCLLRSAGALDVPHSA